MIDPVVAVTAALDVAAEGLARGEMPVGAVVFAGEEILSRAHTQERTQRRRIVHADLLAMEDSDHVLGFTRPGRALTLAVSLEPCLMCLGAAITLGVNRIFYALESPNDGAVDLLRHWAPPVEQPFFQRPGVIEGGIQRGAAQALFAQYARGDGPVGMRTWCAGLAGL